MAKQSPSGPMPGLQPRRVGPALRTRTRLLLTFVTLHLALSLLLGLVAWHLLDGLMREQATESAGAMGRLIAQSRSAQTDENLRRIRELTGLNFQVLPAEDADKHRAAGWICVPAGDQVVAADYRTPEYRAAARGVFGAPAMLLVSGGIAFAVMAWAVAAGLSRPLERLAGEARAIGQGRLDHPIAPVGSSEIHDLSGELERMRASLVDLQARVRRSERLSVLGAFTATIAHEVRNPLSAVRLTVQLLARRYDDEGLRLVQGELERLDLTVDELLAFSRGITVVAEPCDLAAVAADVCRLLARQAEHAQVRLEVQGGGRVRGDPRRLRQVLLNLLLNAIQVQHGGGRVAIILASDGFAIEDDGPGVSEDQQAQLFDAFTSGRRDGTGLGLHIARTMVEAQGGRIAYEAREKGARFRVSGLPATGDSPGEEGRISNEGCTPQGI